MSCATRGELDLTQRSFLLWDRVGEINGFEDFKMFWVDHRIDLSSLVWYESKRLENGCVSYRVRGLDAATQTMGELVNKVLENLEAFNAREGEGRGLKQRLFKMMETVWSKMLCFKDNNTQLLEYTTLIALTAVVAAGGVMVWKGRRIGGMKVLKVGDAADGDDGDGGIVDGPEIDADNDGDNNNGDNDKGDKNGEKPDSAMCWLTWEAPPQSEWGNLLDGAENMWSTPDGVN